MPSTLREELLAKYAGEYTMFIETGTARGDGVQVAIDHGFDGIYSIEANADAFAKASKRFAYSEHVLILLGNSPDVLANMLHGLKRPAVFWLDAHHSTGEPSLPAEASPCPLLRELEVIGKHRIKSHLIMIDDCRYFWGTGIEQWGHTQMIDIVGRIKDINPEYWFSFDQGITPHDILVAKCPMGEL